MPKTRKQWILLLISLFIVTSLGFLQDLTKQPVLGEQDKQPTSSAPPAQPDRPLAVDEGFVKKVVDGDTIELQDGAKLRYIGIDTPETKHPDKPVQCFGMQAFERNKQLVEGKIVRLEKDVSNTDRYGRLLRYVYVDNVLVNETLVKEGFAFARSFPPDIAKQTQFKEAEALARENHLGLWSTCEIKNGSTQ